MEAEVTRIRRVSHCKIVRKGETKPRSGVLRFEQIQGDKLFDGEEKRIRILWVEL